MLVDSPSIPDFNAMTAMVAWMQAIAPYGIFVTDKSLHLRSWNDWLMTQSGRPAAEILGRPLLEAFPEVAERQLDRHYRLALGGEIVVLSTALHRYLLRFPSLAGDEANPHMLQTVRIAPLLEKGEVIGTITVIEDVTQREIQATLLQRQREMERLLSSALALLLQSRDPGQEMPGIFALIAPVLRLDAYLTYLIDATGDYLILHAAGGISPKGRETVAKLSLSLLDQSRLRSPSVPADLNIADHLPALGRLGLRASGSFPLLVGDQLLGLIVFASYQQDIIPPEDVSILSRFARYIALALDRSQHERDTIEASRAKDDFLAALSHELRTPLNPVLLLASESKEYPSYPAEAREAFRVIEKNVQLEARLIDDLLDITRIEHGKMVLELETVDLHEVINDAIGTLMADVARQEMKFELELSATAHTVRGDPARLQQVLWNVVKNALKFTAARGWIRVATKIDPTGRELIVTVSDNGIGMTSTELARIFAAFSQGDHASGGGHRFGGLGLGLAISRRLIEAHGGRIDAASAGKGLGSVFTVTLPLVAPVARRPAGQTTSRSTSPFVLSATPVGTILVVEDHDASRSTLTVLLKRRGFAVTAAASAAEALTLAGSNVVDLVISDIGLPDMDGAALMQKLREQYGLTGIALTGYGMEEDMARTTDVGFLAHLTKPITVDALDRALLKVFPQNQPT